MSSFSVNLNLRQNGLLSLKLFLDFFVIIVVVVEFIDDLIGVKTK